MILLERNDIKINVKSKYFLSSYCIFLNHHYRGINFTYHEIFEKATPLHVAIDKNLYKVIELLLLNHTSLNLR